MNSKYLFLPFSALFMSSAFAMDMSLDTEKKKMSYAIGMQIGKDFSRNGMDIDVTAMSTAISDMLEGRTPKLNSTDVQQALSIFRDQQMKKQMQKQMATGGENKKAGEEFLAKNKSQDGIIVLPSGLQYKVLTKGSGKSPTLANSVVAHYEGRLIDGTVFDSSIKRGQPATFPVTGVIKGWTEILQKMKTGSKWQVYIPSDLAYGARGTGQLIEPHSALIFDIELLEIK